MDSSNSKHKIQISTEFLKPYKNKSNNDSVDEKMTRYSFKSNKLMSINNINKYVIRFFNERYNNFHKIKDRSIEFNFCTKNNGRFGITEWVPLDQTLTEEEWEKEISKIDINKTLSLYEGEEKVFEENIKRDKFWLTFRFRPNIGYASERGLVDGSPDSNIGFCFFDALRDANVINITKHKIIKSYGVYVYKYNESMESVYSGIVNHIKNLNKLNESKRRTNEIIYIDDNGGIDIKDMPKLEKFFKCNIFINFNNQFKDKYVSPKKFNRTVYLKFHNGHYELEKDYKPVFDFYDDNALYINNKKLDILIHDDEKYYDGKNYFNIDELDTEETSLLYNSKHIINYKKLKKDYGSDDIKTIHDMYKKDCEELEKYGIKMLNSYSLQKALFQMLKLDIRYLNLETERITDYAEYEILKHGTRGSYNYIYKFDEIFKNVYSYDVKSAYPSILNHPDFKIPLKRGEYKYVDPEIFKKYIELKTDKNGFYKIELQYGLYKCKISKSDKSEASIKSSLGSFGEASRPQQSRGQALPSEETTKSSLGSFGDYKKFDDFIISKYNIYTHFDILLAKVLGYDVELLNENIYSYVRNDIGKPFNCFVYKADTLIDSNIIFRKLIKKLFDIKQKCKGNRIIKILSSGIWGNFCDDHTYYKKQKPIKKEGDTFNLNLENNEYLVNTTPYIKDEENSVICQYKKEEELTRTSLFRMKPFLLAFQKYIMYIECIKKIEDAGGKILKIKVDAVYTDKMIDEFEASWPQQSRGQALPSEETTKSSLGSFGDENKENKSEYIDGDIIREKHFDIILFKDKTYYLTTEKEIDEYLKFGKTKSKKKSKKK